MLDDKQIKEVCKLGQGEKCCRYLICGGEGFECAKLMTPLKYDIDYKASTMSAKGDNCEGKS